MNKNPDPKVPFTSENINRCMCPGCPVQAESQCVSEKMGKLSEVMEAAKGKTPNPEDIPAVYCSTGVASCKGLDFSQMCICGTCSVWHQYKLVKGKPVYYFCRDGKAQ